MPVKNIKNRTNSYSMASPLIQRSSSYIGTYMLPKIKKLPMPKLNFSLFIQGSAQAWCLLIFSLGIWSGITSHLGARVPLIAAALLMLLFFIHYFYRTKDDSFADRTWTRTGYILLAVLSAATYAWAYFYDSNQTSDFGLYYRCGITLRDTVPNWINNCQSNFFYTLEKTYWSRSVLYTAPFGVIFGNNYLAFKLYNATLHVATMAALFFGIRAYRGARVATIALFLFGIYPEWVYSITVATPDNLALFCVISFLLLLPPLLTSDRGLVLIIGIAATMFVANLSRTIGPFLVITLCLWGLTNMRREQWRRSLFRLVGIIALYSFGNWLFTQAINSPAQDQFQFLQRISTVDLNQPLQNFRLVFGWIDQFLPVVPPEWRSRIISHKILLEISEGFTHYPSYLYVKAKIFFEGTGYYFFSSTDFGPNPDSAVTAKAFSVPANVNLPGLLGALVLFQICLSWFGLLRTRHDPLFSVSVFFTSIFLLVIIGLGDTQQRYSLLIAPAIAITSAIMLFPNDMARSTGLENRPHSVTWTIYGALFIYFIYLAGSFLAEKAAIRIPKPFMHATQETEKLIDGKACNSKQLLSEADYKRLRIITQPDTTCFSFWIPLPGESKSLSFFVSRDHFPFPFEAKTISPYRYRVEHKGVPLFEGSLGDKTVRWHQFNIKSRVEESSSDQNGITLIVFGNDISDRPEAFNIWLMSTSGKTVE